MKTTTLNPLSESKAELQPKSMSQLSQIAGAIILGLVVLYAVGFLPTAEAHNAAHDTRHTFAFPCH